MLTSLTAVIVAVLILPGLAFLRGLYLPSAFSRSVEHVSPTTQVASIVVVSLFANGIWFLIFLIILPGKCTINFDQMDLLISGHVSPLQNLCMALSAAVLLALVYITGTIATGLVVGFVVGKSIVNDVLFMRSAADHSWVYDLVSIEHPESSWHTRIGTWIGRKIREIVRPIYFVLLRNLRTAGSRSAAAGDRQDVQPALRSETSRMRLWLDNLATEPRLVVRPNASVLCKGRDNELLVYCGVIKTFGINEMGQFNYVVLKSSSLTRFRDKYRNSHRVTSFVLDPVGALSGSTNARQLFHIHGSNIINIAVDIKIIVCRPADLERLESLFGLRLDARPTGSERRKQYRAIILGKTGSSDSLEASRD